MKGGTKEWSCTTHMDTKTCQGCYWETNCPFIGERCNDYSPLKELELEQSEYIDDMLLRLEVYDGITRKFDDPANG
jgi:hypothetical protein